MIDHDELVMRTVLFLEGAGQIDLSEAIEALAAERDRLKAALEALDAAPAVCEWEADGKNLWFARCPKQMGHRSYSQPPSHCPTCGKPIKFTEAK